MRTTLLLALMFLLPGVAAHGIVGIGTPAGVTPTVGVFVPAHAPADVADTFDQALVFAPEADVTLLRPVIGAGNDDLYASAPTTEYDLRFVCPDITKTNGLPQTGQDPPTACPAYVLDTEDVLGQPDLVVDPRNDQEIAFHAMHGGPGIRAPTQDPQPTGHSRDDLVHQPHTTFQTRNGGAIWKDNRYHAPLKDYAEVFGEDNAIALDPHGNIVLASLYSHRAAAGEAPAYTVVLWQTDNTIDKDVDYEHGLVARQAPNGTSIDSLDLAWHPGAKLMTVLWRDVGPDGPRVHVERLDGQWLPWNQTAAVGPCDVLSNAVPVGHDLVFACGVGSDTRIWAIDDDFIAHDLGTAPMHGMTSLRLADASSLQDGGIVLIGATAREGRTRVFTVWGVDGDHWGRPAEHGDSITSVAQHPGGTTVLEAHVTAAAVLGTSGTVHFIVQERFSQSATTLGAAGTSSPFGKTYAVVQSSGRFLGTFGIGYGDPQSRAAAPPTVAGPDGGVYADAHDGMAVIQGKRGEERLLIAFGDNGYVRIGEVVEVQAPVPVIPPIAAPAAIPTLTSATSPVLVGAVAGVLSMAAVSRIVLARSKKAAEVQA